MPRPPPVTPLPDPDPHATRVFSRERKPLDLRGSMVGGYQIEREIGRGSMGVVYLALHPLLGTRAAVKVLLTELAARTDLADRFVAEARATAALRHPHIVQIFDLVAMADGRMSIVMEYVEGDTLENRAGTAPMAPQRAKTILLQLCSARSAAHQSGIVHRDLKAQNVLLVGNSTRDYVKLLDFGLAKTEVGDSSLTSPGTVLGTPHYMAPEQVLGEVVDRRVDVYALGILAYRLLTGAVPFQGAAAEVMFSHVKSAPKEPLNVAPELRAIVMKALSKRREDRFSDMAELGRALQVWGQESNRTAVAQRPPTFAARIDGTTITLRFASEEAFLHVDRYELSLGRIFIPGQPPTIPGLFTLIVEVPGRPACEVPATLLGIYDRTAAEKHGIPEGFALTLRGVLSPRAVPVARVAAPPKHKPRARRLRYQLRVTFGSTPATVFEGFTLNMSPSGLGLISQQVVPVGTKLYVALPLVPWGQVVVEGTVAWSRTTEQQAGRMGMLGLHLTHSDATYLRLLSASEAASAQARTDRASTSSLQPSTTPEDETVETERVWVGPRKQS
jgi:hypothetical protein